MSHVCMCMRVCMCVCGCILSCVQEFAHLYSQSRHSRAGMFFTLPVFLVTARLIVNMLFTGLYRLWVKTQEGYDAVQKVLRLLPGM